MKKINNSGFTLIELLVAIVILAIIVFPLLNSFSMSARTAGRAKSVGEATLTAKNLAEQVESMDISKLLGGELGSGVQYIVVDPASGSRSLTSTRPDTDTVVTWMENVGSRGFNARVTFDPTAYTTENDTAISRYSGMDGVYAQSRDEFTDPDLKAHNQFMSYMAVNHPEWNRAAAPTPLPLPTGTVTPTPTPSAAPSPTPVPEYTVQRNINVELNENAGRLYCQVQYEYEIHCSYYKLSEDLEMELENVVWYSSSAAIPFEEWELFPTGYDISSGSYPNIYVMYYPMTYYPAVCDTLDASYGNVTVNVRADNITVDNVGTPCYPATMFLVKQKETGRAMTADENVPCKVVQKLPADLSLLGATIYSNARESFLNAGRSLTSVQYDISYGTYFRRDLQFAGDKNGSDYSLVKKVAGNRIYQVTIEIFEAEAAHDSASPLYSIQTTKLQ